MPAARETSNKATVIRLLDAMNSGDAGLVSQTVDEVFDPGVKQHTPFEATGVQTLKEMVVDRLYRAFPDIHITIEDLIEEGDKVVEKDTVTGTHLGEFNGFRQPANPSPTPRSSLCGSSTAGSPRSGGLSTSSRR